MKVELRKIKIKKLIDGYKDNKEEGVVAYGGKLDVRPPYQREFIYKEEQRDAVIETIRKGFPLNILYWVDHEDGTYEVLDGQQRTLSICQFCNKEFSIKPKDGKRYKFDAGLTDDQRNQILNYELFVYFCTGTDSEKIDWFRVVNVAGVPLNDQELRNAVYHGTWLSEAKLLFSKRNCGAHDIGSKYINGSSIRQDFLQTAIEWINDGDIETYMADNQNEPNAKPLWEHFESVIKWTKQTFPEYRREMKGVDWGTLYKNHKDKSIDPKDLESRIRKLMIDDEVTNKKGVYAYVLDGEERHLNIRTFTDAQKRQKYEEQDKRCAITKEEMPIEEMEADHITPWIEGGKTEIDNLQMISKKENRRKGAK